MTEDMIREQEQIFERLGTSDEGARTRARMQCAQLTSGAHSTFSQIHISADDLYVF